MTKLDYKQKHDRMEELLKLLTEKGELNESMSKELNIISEDIANYEETNFPFEVESQQEMIELKIQQGKFK